MKTTEHMSQTIFITGASSGIGRASVKLFAQHGWNVAATMRHPDAETELQQLPGVKLYALDVTQPDTVKTVVAQALADFGGLDVLLNNAGYGLAGPMETASEDKIMDQFSTNLFGSIRTIQAVLPHFREVGKGIIINITSIGGLVGLPFNSLYHATKFGLDGLSESLNYELRPFGIRVKVVAPGGVATDFASRSLKMTMDGPSAYDKNIQTVLAAFGRNSENHSTAGQIADVIYTAATDGTNQLRYVAGADAQALYSAWKQMSNEDFFAMVNKNFGLEGA